MRKELKILLLASSLFMLAGGLFGPLYAVFVEDIGGDLLTAGGAYAAFSIAAGVLIFIISRWEDHVKHQEKFIIIGYALSCLGYLGYIFVQVPLHLFLVQIVFGVGEAIGVPAYDGLYSKFLDKGRYISEWGVWESMAYIVTGVAAIIGGLLASLYGFRLLFVIMFIASLAGLAISIFLISKKGKRQSK
ncbi:MAG: MFS transporter [Nanoarchaeota archaeon]|nr:MFS transporter [Nanoarchaeota archaeon]